MSGNIYFDEYIQIKRIKDNIVQERRIENKRNMREFLKNKCKKKGANYGKVL